jgi:hypothetical protein
LAEVTDPSGTTWRVSRRLFRLPRWRGRADLLDAVDVGFIDVDAGGFLVSIVAGIVLAIVVTVAIVLVLPLIAFVAELLIAVALVGVKALLGRWTVVAETGRGRATWRVKGSRRSQELVSTVAAALATGAPVPAGSTFETIPSETGPTDVGVREVERESGVRIVDR